MATVYERVRKIVVDQLGVEEDQVVPAASFVDDLNADSLDLVELIMPMYHPAAALHQGNLRKTIEDDFKKIPAVLAKARYEADQEAARPKPQAQPQLAAAGPAPAAQDPQATQLGLF